MKIARFGYQNKTVYGAIDNEIIRLINGSIFGDNISLTGTTVKLNDIKFISPVDPGKIVCVGLNYRDHAKELSMAPPKEPVLFLKPPSSVIGPYDEIIYPAEVERLDYEAELAVVIKRRAKKIAEGDTASYILGYTCLNDVTARDLQKKDGQWMRAKSFDTFCPIGPCIATDIDPDDLKVELSVNNNICQSSRTSSMIFKVRFLVSFISRIMTLFPGDIIATGTPKGVGSMQREDNIKLSIEGIGTLKNSVS